MQPLQNPQPMRAAVVGLGKIGFEFGLENRVQPASHVACYRAIPEISELALCDIDNDKLHTAQLLGATYADYKNMLDVFKPEIVSVCTPTPTHKEIVCEVAKCESVKAIFLEKPIAQSLQEADEMIAVCKDRSINLTVNFTRRWDLMYEQLRILHYEPDAMIGLHPGPLMRSGIHMLDLFNWLMKSQPYAVQAFGMSKNNYLTNEIGEDGVWPDYNVSGIIDYADKKECVLYSGRSVEKLVVFELDILMPTWRIRVIDNGERMEEYGVMPSHRYSGLKEYYPARSTSRVGWYPETPLLTAVKDVCLKAYEKSQHRVDPWLSELAMVNHCSGEDARLALQVALGIHYSAFRANERVMLKDVPKDFAVRSY